MDARTDEQTVGRTDPHMDTFLAQLSKPILDLLFG